MKKLKLVLVCALLCANATVFGQLKVQSDGKTVVYSSATAPAGSAQLTVQHAQSSNAETKGIYSYVSGTSPNTHNLIGIHGYAYKAYEGDGISIGVLGTTGWSINGKNYGVYGSFIVHSKGLEF